MALAAYLSGVTLTSAGLGAVHGFAAPIGANFPVPHGAVCAALLPWVVKANSTGARAGNPSILRRYAELGRALPGGESADQDQAIESLIGFCFKMVNELEIQPLSSFGMGEGAVLEMVALARKSSSMKYNPVELSDAALAEALNNAICGQAE
jgi:alcohol dehydrogenase class IV